jgi:hypothetical protein
MDTPHRGPQHPLVYLSNSEQHTHHSGLLGAGLMAHTAQA